MSTARAAHLKSALTVNEESRRFASQLVQTISAADVTARSYPAGVELFHQGDRAEDVFFLEAGIAKLVCSEESGRELITDIRMAGSLLGLSAVIRNESHNLTAITCSKCQLIRLSSQTFRELIQLDPTLANTLPYVLSEEIVNQTARIADFACLNARQRLENFIWRITQQLDWGMHTRAKLQLPLKQWEVAQFLAITPGYLCRLLAELESEKLITRRGGWIVISADKHLWHRET